MPRKRNERKKDQDGVYIRKDSPYWWASWTDGSGRPARDSTRVRRDEDPQGKMAKLVRARWVVEAEQAWEAMARPIVEVPGHSFDELMLPYLNEVTPTKRSAVRDRASAKELFKVFSKRALAEITGADVREYIRSRRLTVSASTVNKEISLMSAALTWARKELDWEVPNLFKGRMERLPPARDRWLTPEEADRLIEAARESRSSRHLVPFIELTLMTAMRSGELLGLEWHRVDFAVRLVYLGAVNQKNGKVGSVPLSGGAVQALETLKAYRDEHCPESPWVFSDVSGRRIESIYKGFRAAVERADLKDVHPHDLRRTCASWLVQKGVPIAVVSRLLRHSDISLTHRVYAHLSPAEVRDAVDMLDTLGIGG